ncbi:MAG: lamin tail domain-containing protein [Chloroflexi bacterium]|nr:lamin tail domain-containing protein [Chloroflexota bacterium]
MSNVDAGDFAVNGTTTATVTSASGIGSVYDVTISGGNLSGLNDDVGLDFSASPNITDTAGNSFVKAEPSTDEVYTVDNTAPTVTINKASGQANPASTLPINFAVVFSEPISVSSFTSADITQDGTATVNTWSITDSGDQTNFTLSATAVAGSGTLKPSIAVNLLTDLAGNDNTAGTSTDTVSYTPIPTLTPTPTSSTPTPTITRTATPVTACVSSLKVAINEVAWAGTGASSSDEWIELCNPGTTAVDLSGWQLKGNAPDSSPDPVINLTGTIPPGGYFLLERTDETTVSNITADQIYTGDLLDAGEILILYNAVGERVDTANIDGGSWPAGSATNQRSMERRSSTLDSPTSWVTFFGTSSYQNGKDAKGNAINGTPKARNWTTIITPTSTAVSPTRVRTATPKPVGRPIINEYLPRPGFDWNQDGTIDVFDEFIEITNVGPVDISISGWKLDDEAGIGSSPFTLPDVTLKPGQHLLFYGLETNILLSDGGDTVRLLNSNGQVWDAHTYSIVKETDKSVCRLPDGYGSWFEDCLPTPNMVNSREGEVPAMPPGNGLQPAICNLPDTLPADFLVAECHGYGANMWRSMYWDEKGWQGDNFVPENTSKWPSFVE